MKTIYILVLAVASIAFPFFVLPADRYANLAERLLGSAGAGLIPWLIASVWVSVMSREKLGDGEGFTWPSVVWGAIMALMWYGARR